MMNYLKHFEYEAWANKMIYDAINAIPEKDERALLLFSHLLSAHCMWLSRIKGEELSCTLFQERTIEECATLMRENMNGWTSYLRNITEEEVQRVIHFILPIDGSKRKMKVEDVLTHIINHSSYHRGQIVARMKGKLDELPNSTFIVYASEMDVEDGSK